MATTTKCGIASQYFLIILCIIFFMILYVYMGTPVKVKEPFYVSSDYKLIPGERMVVMQGNGIPDIPVEASMPDVNDSSSPSVDGNPSSQKSKLMFAYNECKPECCATSGGYACNGGCPCMTKEQLGYALSCGTNSKPRLCGDEFL